MIAIIDYGAGNLRSVSNVIAKLGYQSKVTSDPGEVLQAEVVIFPGVGAAADTMDNLKKLVIKGTNLTIRIPIIPGYNDSKDNLERIIVHIKNLGLKVIDFLPYNSMSEYKYKLIGVDFKLKNIRSNISEETVKNIKNLAKLYDLEANIEL